MSSLHGSAALIVGPEERPRGSAFRISDSLFLTAAHFFREPDKLPKVRLLNSPESFECAIIWKSDERFGLAVIQADVPTQEASPVFQEANYGRFSGQGLRRCEITGFIPSWNNPASDAIAARIAGYIDPDQYPESSFFMFEPSSSSPDREWRFLQGSGVCFDGLLVGILLAFDNGRSSFLVASITTLLDHPACRAALRKALQHDIDITSIESAEASVSDALNDISRADPSNILEVASAQFRLSDRYYENVLSQARRSFNAAVVAAVTGTLFFLVAIAFAVASKQLTAAYISSIGGGVVEVVSGLNFWLYARTSIQLNYFHMRLERMQRYLVANSVAASLSDDRKESALVELVKTIAKSEQTKDAKGADSPPIDRKAKGRRGRLTFELLWLRATTQ